MDHSWFKLLVRLIGLLIFTIAITPLFQMAEYLVLALTSRAGNSDVTWILFRGCSTLLQVGIGVYMLRGAPGFVRNSLRHVAGRCPSCDYDVRGVTATQCPECGYTLPRTAPVSKPLP